MSNSGGAGGRQLGLVEGKEWTADGAGAGECLAGLVGAGEHQVGHARGGQDCLLRSLVQEGEIKALCEGFEIKAFF